MALASPKDPKLAGHEKRVKKFETCLIISFIVFTISIVAFAGCILIITFCVFGPCAPAFHVEQVNLHYPIFYTGPTRYSSLLNITMKVRNPSWTFGMLYESDNSIVASYSEIRLSGGMIPPFQLSPTEEKVVEARLTGVGMDVADDMRMNLADDHERERVPLSFDMTSMVRFKIGSRTILSAVVKSYCDLDLDNLDDFYHPPRIISRICDSQAGFWFHSITTYRTF